jgi:hypothetical protein
MHVKRLGYDWPKIAAVALVCIALVCINEQCKNLDEGRMEETNDV